MQTVATTPGGSRTEDVLGENEAQFRAIFADSAMSIALVDMSGRIVRCNQALEQLLGYSEAELKGKNYIQFIHPEDASSSQASFGQLVNGSRPAFQVERRVQRKNGQVFVARSTVSLLRDPGRPSLALAMIEDMTEMRRLAAAARAPSPTEFRRKNSSVLKEALTLAAVGLVVCALGCCFRVFEPMFEMIWAYRSAVIVQILGTIIVLGPVLAVLSYQRWKENKSPAGPSSRLSEALQVLNDELEKRVQQRAAELVKGQAALQSEIMERRRAEQTSRDSEERFRQLAQNIDQVFWISDTASNELIYVSPAYETIWGRTCESVLQQPGTWLEAIHPDDRQRVQQAAPTKQTPGEYDQVYRVIRPDGAVRWIRDRAFPLRNGAGEVYRVVGTATDITAGKQAEDKLRKLSRAVEQSPVSIIITDRSGRIEYVNPKFTAVTGYSPADVAGKTPSVLKSGEMPPATYQQMWSTIASGQEWHGELLNRKKNGELFWEWASISPITDADGKISHFVGVKEDITQSKQMIEAMRESEERFRTAVETAPDAIYIQTDGLFAYVNAAAVHLFGAAGPEALLGQSVLDRVHPDHRALTQERIQRTNELRHPVEMIERECLKMDGSPIQVEVSAVPFTFQKKAGALVFARDITERQRAQQRIHEQAELLDKAHDAICVQDLAQRILYWNKGAERLYGWSTAEAVGRKTDDLLFNGDSEKRLQARCQLMRNGEWRGELDQLDSNGGKLVVESHWSLMRDESWKPKSILMINTDVTEKKQTEARFLRTQRMENLGALAAGIAHDLNNVLAPVMMAAEALHGETTSAEDRQMLEIIRSSAQRGSEMVKQILFFARGVGGQHQPVALNHLISDIEEFAKRTFPPSIQVCKKLANDLFLVQGDATQLHQILLNLCVNARDAMANGGELTLEARNIQIDQTYAKRQACGPHVMLTVSDTGHGIPAELLDRIFEPFFTTKELGRGTGLGLSTVVGLVKTHGGFLEVSSQPGKGTTFRVFLPAASGAIQPAAPPASAVPAGNGELILVADDNAAVLEMLKVSLEAHNYRVLTASNGTEALRLYQEHPRTIRALVTDMLMPDLNGAELIQALRQLDPTLKVIGATGQGSADELVSAAQPLVDGFLTKPFSTQSLLLKLRQVLG